MILPQEGLPNKRQVNGCVNNTCHGNHNFIVLRGRRGYGDLLNT